MTKRRRASAVGPEARKSFYAPDDIDQLDYTSDLGDPGNYPYTRGIYADMYRSRLWTMRQYAGYGTAEESNLRYRYLLSQGTTGLSVAFDLPTQIGIDSDHPQAAGEVGRVGVAVDSHRDMQRLFKEIPLDSVSTSMTINATAAIILAMYLEVARSQNVPWSALRGTIQNDILKEYIARGTYVYPPAQSLRLVTDTIAFCHKKVPRWNTISVSGYHMREAGATAAQEVAFTLANAETYVEAALDAGLKVDEFAPRVSFFFSSHNDFFEEIGKFRAARRIWARLMKVRFKAEDERSMRLRFHTQTAGSALTAQQPDNNVVRVAYQALAAVLGGTQSLHTNAKDEALALPTEESATLALRTQQILAHESRAALAADPLGGSYLVESLTRELEEEAESYIEEIRSIGGVLGAIENGYIQRQIQEAAYDQQMRIEKGLDIAVGVNRFADEKGPSPELLRIDQKLEGQQVERLEQLKAERDSSITERALDEIREAATGSDNLLPVILSAVQADATVGEIASALEESFGLHKETIVV